MRRCAAVMILLLAICSDAAAVTRRKAAALPVAVGLNIFKQATFLLPEGASLSTHWVLPPTENTRTDAKLSVDAEGAPLISYADHYLLSPTKEYLVALQGNITGMTRLANGVLLLAVGSDIGILAKPKQAARDKEGVPLTGFQPLATVPLDKIEVLSGAGISAYIAGHDPLARNYAVYLLKPVPGAGLEHLELLYESSNKITAVTGNDEATFVAVGNKVLRIPRNEGDVTTVYTHPSDTVSGLALIPGGLLVSTGRELVLTGQNGTMEIMRSSGHDIVMSGKRLYILFQNSLGVLAVDNLDELRRFNLAVRPVTQGPPPLLVKSVRFFESGPPPYINPIFADSFERSNVRRIVAQLDFRSSLPAGKQAKPRKAEPHNVTLSWYEPTGGQLMSSTHHIVLNEKNGMDQLLAPIGQELDRGGYPLRRRGEGGVTYKVGKDGLGMRYPGRYRMQVQVDGIPAGEWYFTLTGPAKPFEAIFYDDIAMLESLITQGLSPDYKDEDGDPLLNVAVKFGSTRAVKLLMDKGANPNQTDNEGKTALADCSNWLTQDWRPKAELLVLHGADVNALIGKDKIPLIHTTSFKPEYTTFLLNHGVSINTLEPRTRRNVQDVMADSFTCSDELISALLQHGGNLNTVSEVYPRMSPLGRAISSNNYNCTALLLGKGASLFASVQRESNRPESSALYVALKEMSDNADFKDTERAVAARRIVRLLVDKGAALKPGKKLSQFRGEAKCSIYDSACNNRQFERQISLSQGEGRLMFRGDAPSFFDEATLTRTLSQDDAALDEADNSVDPFIRELALRSHLDRVRELASSASDKYELNDANDHCKKAFKLAESAYSALQADMTPGIRDGKPFIGLKLLARAEGGAYVQNVVAGEVAAQQGIRQGDIILAVNTRKIAKADEVALALPAAGTSVRLTLLRDESMKTPELLLSCGLLEQELNERDLAEMNLSRWLSANPGASDTASVRALLNRQDIFSDALKRR